MNSEQLAEALKITPIKAEEWIDAINETFDRFDISTPERQACFLGQCAHESGGFRSIKENLNYRPETLVKLFGRYFDLSTAQQYCNMPNKQEAIANRIYANRMGNGPESSGDGYRFCGRGLIQLTGKDNYQAYADATGQTVEEASEHMTTFEGCVQSACWFWEANNLNKWADAGDIKTMTKIINGGYIGLEDRIKHYDHALHVFGAH